MNSPRTQRRWLRWGVGLGVASLFMCFVFPWLLPNGPRWYLLNPRYALWRCGWYGYDKQVVYTGLNGDIWRNEVVRGKTFPELQSMFKDLRVLSEFDAYDLAKVSSRTNAARTFLKWDDTSWFIEVTNGRAAALHLWKG